MNICDYCGKKSDFNTEIRISPTDTNDKLVWGRMKICLGCRELVSVQEVYNKVLGELK